MLARIAEALRVLRGRPTPVNVVVTLNGRHLESALRKERARRGQRAV